MAKVKFINDLPPWFDLKNYDVIRGLSIDDIKVQLLARRTLLINDSLEGFSNMEAVIERYGVDGGVEQWLSIVDGKVILRQFPAINGYQNDELYLSFTGAVRGFSSPKAVYHTAKLVNKGVLAFEDRVNLREPYYTSEWCADYSLVQKNTFKSSVEHVTIDLDLAGHSDDELISHLKELLPRWRQELNTPKPKKRIGKSDDFFSRVKTNMIIPLLDLRIWEKIYNVKIDQNVLTLALYPKNPMTTDTFKNKVRDLEKQVLNDSYRHKAPIFTPKK